MLFLILSSLYLKKHERKTSTCSFLFFVKMISEKLRRIFCGNYNGGENMYRIYSTLIEMVAAAVFIIPIWCIYNKLYFRSWKITFLYMIFGFYYYFFRKIDIYVLVFMFRKKNLAYCTALKASSKSSMISSIFSVPIDRRIVLGLIPDPNNSSSVI